MKISDSQVNEVFGAPTPTIYSTKLHKDKLPLIFEKIHYLKYNNFDSLEIISSPEDFLRLQLTFNHNLGKYYQEDQ